MAKIALKIHPLQIRQNVNFRNKPLKNWKILPCPILKNCIEYALNNTK
jgi:hypothetical protein